MIRFSVLEKELKNDKALMDALPTLAEFRYQILSWRIIHDWSLYDIGSCCNITEKRVRQIINHSIDQLKIKHMG